MLSRVIAKNIGDVFFETQCIFSAINSVNRNMVARNYFFKKYCKTLNFGIGVNLIILDPVILAFLLPTTLKRYCIQIFVANYFRELARLAKFPK